jgi:hypothetical protein
VIPGFSRAELPCSVGRSNLRRTPTGSERACPPSTEIHPAYRTVRVPHGREMMFVFMSLFNARILRGADSATIAFGNRILFSRWMCWCKSASMCFDFLIKRPKSRAGVLGQGLVALYLADLRQHRACIFVFALHLADGIADRSESCRRSLRTALPIMMPRGTCPADNRWHKCPSTAKYKVCRSSPPDDCQPSRLLLKHRPTVMRRRSGFSIQPVPPPPAQA